MKTKVYFYCVEYQEEYKRVRKSGFFECNEIKSSKDGGKVQELIKENLAIKTDNFALISLNVIGTKDNNDLSNI